MVVVPGNPHRKLECGASSVVLESGSATQQQGWMRRENFMAPTA